MLCCDTCLDFGVFVFCFFKQKTAYEMLRSLVGSEMCIRDSVRTYQLLEKVLDLMEEGVDYSFASSTSLKKSNLCILSGRMLKELLVLVKDGTLQECKLRWNKLGMMSSGNLSMPKTSECHKTESVSLQSVLEKEVEEKYYLSRESQSKILSRI